MVQPQAYCIHHIHPPSLSHGAPASLLYTSYHLKRARRTLPFLNLIQLLPFWLAVYDNITLYTKHWLEPRIYKITCQGKISNHYFGGRRNMFPPNI